MSHDRRVLSREHLLTAALSVTIDRIEAHRIDFPPGQRAGPHSHPGGVVGYIVEGTIVFEIDGQPAVTLRSGDVFYEPPSVIINRFDNASDSAGASFIAFYPLSDDQPLITMLQP